MSKKEIDIIILDEIDSTNNEAQRIIDHKSNFPLWIIANEQTSGRGRKNRYWVSQKGNFMGTFILEHEIEKQYIPHLSFVTSLALKKTIESFNSGIKDIFLKWRYTYTTNYISMIVLGIQHYSDELSAG